MVNDRFPPGPVRIRPAATLRHRNGPFRIDSNAIEPIVQIV